MRLFKTSKGHFYDLDELISTAPHLSGGYWIYLHGHSGIAILGDDAVRLAKILEEMSAESERIAKAKVRAAETVEHPAFRAERERSEESLAAAQAKARANPVDCTPPDSVEGRLLIIERMLENIDQCLPYGLTARLDTLEASVAKFGAQEDFLGRHAKTLDAHDERLRRLGLVTSEIDAKLNLLHDHACAITALLHGSESDRAAGKPGPWKVLLSQVATLEQVKRSQDGRLDFLDRELGGLNDRVSGLIDQAKGMDQAHDWLKKRIESLERCDTGRAGQIAGIDRQIPAQLIARLNTAEAHFSAHEQDIGVLQDRVAKMGKTLHAVNGLAIATEADLRSNAVLVNDVIGRLDRRLREIENGQAIPETVRAEWSAKLQVIEAKIAGYDTDAKAMAEALGGANPVRLALADLEDLRKDRKRLEWLMADREHCNWVLTRGTFSRELLDESRKLKP